MDDLNEISPGQFTNDLRNDIIGHDTFLCWLSERGRMLEMDSLASGNLEVMVVRAAVMNLLNSSGVVVFKSFIPR